MFLLSDVTDLKSFAKREDVNVGIGTLSNWLDRWAKAGNEPVKPVAVFGNVQTFLVKDLEMLRDEYKRNSGPKTVKIEQYNEVVERAQRLAVENATLVARIRDLEKYLGFDQLSEPVELLEYDNVPAPVGANEV